ncbi:MULTISPECIES: hypothetical protein [Cysteiniphilum]|uniref:Phage tail tape measure protein n=1 Tax=Cysteiniphilum litorale TaxID=2056700 RepID=A0A8J2Z5R5_9GAMM|nr:MULTISPECIES: hypothetical protein [Cysteiniphilum]GGG02873.1 hypothetical protein GCM10010995_20380 [Cysteiniphilum litorale]
MSNWNKKVSLELGGSINPSFSRATDDAAKSLGMLGRKEKALKDNKALIGKLQADQAAIAKTNTAYKTQVAELKALQRAYNAAGGQDATLSAKISKKQQQVNKTNAKLSEQRKGLQNLGTSLKKAGIDTANLTSEEKRLQMQLEKTQKHAKLKGKTLSTLGSGVSKLKYAALGATAAIGAMGAAAMKSVNSFAEHGDNVAKTADKLNVSTTSLQEMRYAAERAGLSTDKLDKSLEFMQKNVVDAAQGTGEAKDALNQLGLSADELKSLKPDQALGLIADRMKGVTNNQERLRMATRIFGREGAGMVNMLRDGSKGLKEMGAEANRVGYVLNEKSLRAAEANRDAYLNMTTSIKGMWFSIGNELMPKLTEMFSKLTDWIAENRGQIGEWVKSFSSMISSVFSGIKTIGSFIQSTIGLDNAFKIVGGTIAFSLVNKIVNLGSVIKGLGMTFKLVSKLFLTNPIGLAITGIATAALLIYKYWEPIKDFFAELWDGIKSIFNSAIDFIAKLFEPQVKMIKWVAEKATSVAKFFGFGGSEKEDKGNKTKEISSKKSLVSIKESNFDPDAENKIDWNKHKPLKIEDFRQLKQQVQTANQQTNNHNRTNNVTITNQVTVQGNGDKNTLMQGIEQATQKALYDFNLGGV